MEGPFKFWLWLLEIQMVGAPDPQQKKSTESPARPSKIYHKPLSPVFKNAHRLIPNFQILP